MLLQAFDGDTRLLETFSGARITVAISATVMTVVTIDSAARHAPVVSILEESPDGNRQHLGRGGVDQRGGGDFTEIRDEQQKVSALQRRPQQRQDDAPETREPVRAGSPRRFLQRFVELHDLGANRLGRVREESRDVTKIPGPTACRRSAGRSYDHKNPSPITMPRELPNGNDASASEQRDSPVASTGA